MRETRLVVKRRRNGKQVSKMTRREWQFLGEHLTSKGLGGGIVNLLLPRNATERQQLVKNQRRYVAAEVKRRETQNPNNVFNNTTFAVAICEWWIKANAHIDKVTIDAIAEELANQHAKIAEGAPTRDLLLEKIFQEHSPDLIDVQRAKSWWEKQIRQRRYGRK